MSEWVDDHFRNIDVEEKLKFKGTKSMKVESKNMVTNEMLFGKNINSWQNMKLEGLKIMEDPPQGILLAYKTWKLKDRNYWTAFLRLLRRDKIRN